MKDEKIERKTKRDGYEVRSERGNDGRQEAIERRRDNRDDLPRHGSLVSISS